MEEVNIDKTGPGRFILTDITEKVISHNVSDLAFKFIDGETDKGLVEDVRVEWLEVKGGIARSFFTDIARPSFNNKELTGRQLVSVLQLITKHVSGACLDVARIADVNTPPISESDKSNAMVDTTEELLRQSTPNTEQGTAKSPTLKQITKCYDNAFSILKDDTMSDAQIKEVEERSKLMNEINDRLSKSGLHDDEPAKAIKITYERYLDLKRGLVSKFSLADLQDLRVRLSRVLFDTEMPQYKCDGVFGAVCIKRIDVNAKGAVLLFFKELPHPYEVTAGWVRKYQPAVGGYLVSHKGEYVYAPAKTFQEECTPVMDVAVEIAALTMVSSELQTAIASVIKEPIRGKDPKFRTLFNSMSKQLYPQYFTETGAKSQYSFIPVCDLPMYNYLAIPSISDEGVLEWAVHNDVIQRISRT